MDTDEVTKLLKNPQSTNTDDNDENDGADCIFSSPESGIDVPNMAGDCIFLTALIVLILVGVFTVIVSANLAIITLGRALEPYICQCTTRIPYTSTLPAAGYIPT
jgi:hypothetical protein